MQTHTLPPDGFLRKALGVIGLVTAVALLLILLWQIADILVILFAGILLGVLLTGSSGWIREHSPLSHRQALGVTMLGLLLLLGLGGALAAPSLVEQGQQLGSNLEESVSSLETTLSNQAWAQPLLNRLPDPQQLGSSMSDLMNQVSGVFSRTFNMLTNVVVILFVGFYLAYAPDKYANGLIRLTPPNYRHRAGEVLDEIAYTLRWWLIGRLASMVIVGVLSVIGLFVLGIPLAFILGVLAGLLAFIPIVGPALALIFPVLVAFTISPTQALYVFLLYMGIQIVESYFITPVIQQRTVDLPPVLLIISQVLFSYFFSFVGLAVAAPFAAMMLTATKMLYLEDFLGDDPKLLKDNPDAHFAASRTNSHSQSARAQRRRIVSDAN